MTLALIVLGVLIVAPILAAAFFATVSREAPPYEPDDRADWPN